MQKILRSILYRLREQRHRFETTGELAEIIKAVDPDEDSGDAEGTSGKTELFRQSGSN